MADRPEKPSEEALREVIAKLRDELREVADFEEAEWPGLLATLESGLTARTAETDERPVLCPRCSARKHPELVDGAEFWQDAETEEQAAERELGAWLASHPCSTHEWDWVTHPDGTEVHSVEVRPDAHDFVTGLRGTGPTRASAIRAALAKAKGGEGG